jgi:formate dehydrogenase subunit gamma
MAATTGPSADPTAGTASPAAPPDRLLRFDVGERVLHWVNAVLLLTLLATGSALYIPPLSELVGERQVVLAIHVYAGVSLPVPVLLTVAARRWGAAFRADARRLNRWSADDKRWLRSRGRDPWVRNGKFNAGQKLNAAFTLGAIGVMLVTGLVMRFPNMWPLAWRTGATFVHDWVYLAAAVVVTGHILYALSDRDALRSMAQGWVPSVWARRHAPRWYEEETGLPASYHRAGGRTDRRLAPGPGEGALGPPVP